ncbi:DUF423 domain-containing protein [Peredibacter sp. HCB2-198]|uniref:DUF423 domain-containing protein n=1 Tax=Peredibacter sp. HCB2-198 TaxID=3383025 RepID=UPI0038B63369
MTLHPLAKKSLVIGSAFLCLGVLIGAFGAHGLKNIVAIEKLVTFETGVRYHFYHALGMILIGLIQQTFQTLRLNVSYYAFFAGILLFSFNCYFYVLTDIKTFAMIVPLGGLMFVLGWGALTVQALKLR